MTMTRRTRTGKRVRAARADAMVARRIERLDAATAPVKLGTFCPTCQQDTIPGQDGRCLWCLTPIVEAAP